MPQQTGHLSCSHRHECPRCRSAGFISRNHSDLASSNGCWPMNTRPWLLVLGVALVVASRPNAAPRIELHVDLNERVNAVYHLACLARNISCSTDVFERFWKERLGWTDADEAALDSWRRTMTEVTSAAPARPPAPLLPNTVRSIPRRSRERPSSLRLSKVHRSTTCVGEAAASSIPNRQRE